MPHITKIYGAPGTGKTTRMLNLLQEEMEAGIPLERIAFVTHTVVAKSEAKSRAIRHISIMSDDKKLQYFRTIHGICYMEVGLSRQNVMQTTDYLEFGDHIGIPFSADFTSDTDIDGLPLGFNLSGGNEILAVRQLASAKGVMVSDISEFWPNWISPELMKNVILGYAKWKNTKSKFDFVDMLHLYIKHGKPLDIEIMFIDEAQDLSQLQWIIVNKMMKNAKKVYIAGDDDQSIYGFIGADRYGFLDYKSDTTEVLPKTYRLHSKIWNHAQKIISQVQRRQDKIIKTKDGTGNIEYYNNDLLYLDVDTKKTTMIIARHHFHLQRMSRFLEDNGTPHQGRGRNVPGTEQAYAVHAYFRARDGENIELRDAAKIFGLIGDKSSVKSLQAEARNQSGLFINKDRLTKEFNLNWEAPWVSYLAKNAAEITKNGLIRNILNSHGLSGIIDKPNVLLTTYHGCKGMEADHVILLTDCFRKAYDGAQISPDDSLRLSYVGVTRAKENLTIVMPTTDLWMKGVFV